MGPRAGLDGYGKFLSHRHSIPGPSSPKRVAVPTALSRPTDNWQYVYSVPTCANFDLRQTLRKVTGGLSRGVSVFDWQTIS